MPECPMLFERIQAGSDNDHGVRAGDDLNYWDRGHLVRIYTRHDADKMSAVPVKSCPKLPDRAHAPKPCYQGHYQGE